MVEIADWLQKLTEKLTAWFEALVIRLPNLLAALLVIVFGVFAARGLGALVQKGLDRVTDNRQISALLSKLTRVAVLMLAVFVALGVLHLEKTVTSLLASASLASA